MFNRREFIKTSATAGLGTIIAPTSLTAEIRSNSKIKNIGLQVWSIAKTLEKDFKGTIKMLSQIGYKELELYGPYPFSTQQDIAHWNTITPILNFSQSGYFNHSAKEFKELLDNEGLKAKGMHIGFDTLRNKMGETAEAANLMGLQYVGIAAIPEEERRTLDDYKRVADEFNRIGETAKAHGIRFFYHNHGYGLKEMEGKIPFDLVLERTDPSLVYFEMDVFWTIAGGADPLKYLEGNSGRYKLMHVKDMIKQVRFSGDGGNPQQWTELFPYITDAGSGMIDLKTIISRAKQSGVENFIIENDAITNVEKSLKNGYNFLSSLELSD